MSTPMSGARGLITIGKKIVSNSGGRRTCSPAPHQRSSNASQSGIPTSSEFSTVTCNITSSSKIGSCTTEKRQLTTTSSGAILDEPWRHQRFGLLKAILTMATGLSIGAWMSKNMANFLEENELFVPEDDDDDDDDDDD